MKDRSKTKDSLIAELTRLRQRIAEMATQESERRKTEDEKEKLHAQLLQSQKMEAVVQLAEGISHEINNILSAMTGYAHIMKMKMKGDDPLREYTDYLLSLSDRATNLIQNLLSFSSRQITHPRPVNINEVIINSATKQVNNMLKYFHGKDRCTNTKSGCAVSDSEAGSETASAGHAIHGDRRGGRGNPNTCLQGV